MTQINENDEKLIYPELSYKITGLLFSVHNSLGRFCREKQYQDAIEEALKKENIKFEREKVISVAENIGINKADFLIDDKIILECKARAIVTKEDYYQVLRYLKFSEKRLGLLVNFRNTYLRPKRIVN